MITVVHYGMGNIGSLCNMIHILGEEVHVATTPEELATAEKIILPGVGAFDTAMESMERSGLGAALKSLMQEKNLPLLGICLGMQLLTKGSEEGRRPGLGLVEAETVRFRFADPEIKVPHMGWNTVCVHGQHPLCSELNEHSRFYFVHSFYVHLEQAQHALFTTNYGGSDFVSGFAKGTVFGVQFHPEKSHRFGKTLLKHFIEL
ncbi:imidazole glycerol phosphate synthase subunit HisH [Humidesulfovibrio sp.]